MLRLAVVVGAWDVNVSVKYFLEKEQIQENSKRLNDMHF